MNRWISSRCLTLLATAGVLALCAGTARANIIPTTTVVPNPVITGSGPYTYTYDVSVDNHQNVIKRWDNIIGLFFSWKDLDRILHQRSVVDEDNDDDER